MTRAADNKRLPNWGIGVIALVLVIVGFYLAFAKSIPFLGGGYEVKAVFADAQNIRAKSPVRIAGVEVGKVSKVENLVEDGEGQQAAVVTMELKDDARPIHEDATMQLRPLSTTPGSAAIAASSESVSAAKEPLTMRRLVIRS